MRGWIPFFLTSVLGCSSSKQGQLHRQKRTNKRAKSRPWHPVACSSRPQRVALHGQTVISNILPARLGGGGERKGRERGRDSARAGTEAVLKIATLSPQWPSCVTQLVIPGTRPPRRRCNGTCCFEVPDTTHTTCSLLPRHFGAAVKAFGTRTGGWLNIGQGYTTQEVADGG